MASFIPTVSATTLGVLPEFILENFGQKGLDHAYEISGIPEGISTLQNAYIPEASVAMFLESAARLSGEHQLGLIFAPHTSVRSYGTLADYCFEAETLGKTMARYMCVLPYHASHHAMAVQKQGDKVVVRYKHATVGAPNYEQIAYGMIGMIINFLREFTGPNWLPDSICLEISKPRVMSLLEQIYPCPFTFNQPEFCIIFDRELLNLRRTCKKLRKPVTLSDVRRSRSSQAPSSLLDVTSNIIKSQIKTTKTNLGRTAQLFGCSTRTLQRELGYLGLSFRTLTTCIRMNLANELMLETNMSLTDIANELGYSSHAHFTRAYHAENQITPSEFRHAERFANTNSTM